MSSEMTPELYEKLKKIEELKAQQKYVHNLPHLYGQKFYKWSREFWESINPMTVLLSGNQVGKSSIQIRKCIHWATATEEWESIWDVTKRKGTKPNVFWYLYPSLNVATAEFETKWVDEFLPRNEMKTHPKYGWKEKYKHGQIHSIKFNSGVTVYFHAYSKDVHTLQAQTVWCFVEGTKVLTLDGMVDISKLTTSDLVLTRNGFSRVQAISSREKNTAIVRFSNGSSLEGTYDHPILVKGRGWINLIDLNEGDVVCVVPMWKLIEKFGCLRESYISDIQKILIEEEVNTLDLITVNPCTWHYGKVIIKFIYLMVMLSITSILIHLITKFQTFSVYLGQSILESTNLRSGKKLKRENFNVKFVREFLKRDHHRNNQDSTVHQSVEQKQGTIIKKLSNIVESVVRSGKLLVEGITTVLSYVLTGLMHVNFISMFVRFVLTLFIQTQAKVSTAPIPASVKRTVYDIQVECNHEFYANSVLVHNCVFTDEELVEKLYGELKFRTAAVEGKFSMAFTATRGQDLWYRMMERMGFEDEAFPKAKKIRATAYDCLEYEDGDDDTPWTEGKILELKDSCATENEVLKRVYGRFVMDEGLVVSEFVRSKHMVKPFKIPKSWLIYSGVDIGSGGKSGHKGCIIFVAVKPDFSYGVVFRGWKGNERETTTAADILAKYRFLRGTMKPVSQRYDWASKDFFTHASRLNESFVKAEKDHAIGRDLMNTLFKLKMLQIFDIPELRFLPAEFAALTVDQIEGRAKRHAEDDGYDGTRYAITAIPWDTSKFCGMFEEHVEEVEEEIPSEMEIRREMVFGLGDKDEQERIENEIEEFNELYDY